VVYVCYLNRFKSSALGACRQGPGYRDSPDVGSEGNEEDRDIVVPFFLDIN